MLRWCLSSALLLLVVQCTLYLVHSSWFQQSKPAQLGKSYRINLGVVPARHRVPISIKLKNTSTEKVEIENVEVSCGCINLVNLPKSLSEDEEVEIGIIYRTSSSSGPQSQTAVVSCLGKDDSRRYWVLKIDLVVSGIWSDKARAVLRSRKKQKSMSSQVAGQPIQIRLFQAGEFDQIKGLPNFYSTLNHVNVKCLSKRSVQRVTGTLKDSAFAESKITLEVEPGSPVGRHRGFLVCEYGRDNNSSEFKIPIDLEVLGEYRSDPPAFAVVVSPRNKTSRKAILHCESDIDISQLRAVSNNPSIFAAISSNKSNKQEAIVDITLDRISANTTSILQIELISGEVVCEIPITVALGNQ